MGQVTCGQLDMVVGDQSMPSVPGSHQTPPELSQQRGCSSEIFQRHFPGQGELLGQDFLSFSHSVSLLALLAEKSTSSSL